MKQRLWVLVASLLCCAVTSLAQAPTAVVNGQVRDSSGAAIPSAAVVVINDATNVRYTVETNSEGIYSVPNLPPGTYRIQVSKQGFKTIVHPDIVLHVQDAEAIGFTLPVGPTSDTVTVEGGAPLINTENAAVSTVIDRRFVQSLPLNGRTFNMLLQLTPGVVIAPVGAGPGGQGQFSISGQRRDANTFTIDGVSANFGVGNGTNPLESGTGGTQALSAIGATSSLVSVDALQEFRIETSSFAPEFGKTPGGQVILTTRSGTNEIHGGTFDYFRNTVMDANNWFNNATIDSKTGKSVPRAPEHHNDFGGFLGGPIWKSKTFFFLSYEGARLRLPQTQVIQVPFLNGTSCSAPSAIAPYLNAYPKPNGSVSASTCTGQFTGSISNAATLDAGSIRVDHRFNQKIGTFVRYNRAPSLQQAPPGPSTSLSTVTNNQVDTITVTGGLDMMMSSRTSNLLRANYSSQMSRASTTLNSFGGAVPLNSSLLLGSLPTEHNFGFFQTFDIAGLFVGDSGTNRSRQLNVADTLAISARAHQFKFGGDYRAIFLEEHSPENSLSFFTTNVPTFLSTSQTALSSSAFHPSKFLAQSLSLFAQDTWKVAPRLSLTYGLRWEFSPAPSARGNTTLAAWQNVNDPANTALAPSGTPLWASTYSNFAPRLGLAYSLTANGDLVLRGGGGIFYDLGVGASAGLAFTFPNFTSLPTFPTVSVPLSDVSPFLATNFSRQPPWSVPTGFDPDLVLPRSYQWNLALEKSFAGKNAVSVTYAAQAGRDQLRKEALFKPNSNFLGDLFLTRNTARSNYNSLQVQYRRPISDRLRVLLNYTWSHSLDNASNDFTIALPSNIISAENDYASSNFDVRHTFSGAVSYNIPGVTRARTLSLLTRHWSLETIVVARTGFPFNGVVSAESPDPGGRVQGRPDLVPGQPVWISAPGAPGGKALNRAAFSVPSSPRQGTEGRNDIAGFGLTQVDLSVGRGFPITERLNVQFRADSFNLFNHPNFRNPFANIQVPSQLQSPAMLNTSLQGLSPLFQQGGPRSLQLSLKMTF